MDEKTVTVAIPPENLTEFFQCMMDSNIYLFEDAGSGFWTSMKEVRYVSMRRRHEGSAEEDRHSSPEIPPGDEGSESDPIEN